MSLTLDLPPELAQRIAEEAARRGQDLSEYIQETLERDLGTSEAPDERESEPANGAEPIRLAPVIPTPIPVTDPIYAGLRQVTREEMDEIIRKQGTKPFDSAEWRKTSFWPEDEDIDEFIATYRRWRRGEQ